MFVCFFLPKVSDICGLYRWKGCREKKREELKKSDESLPMFLPLVKMVVGTSISPAMATVAVSIATRSEVADRILSCSAMSFHTRVLLADSRLLPAFTTFCAFVK